MVQDACQRARKKGLEFNLTEHDIVIPSHCPALGIPIFCEGGRATANSPSLDRIDPSKGYTRDNIVVVSHRANTLKRDATVLELFLIATFYTEIT